MHRCALSAILLVVCSTSAHAAAEPVPLPPIEAFIDLPQAEQVQLSPDGRYLGMIVPGDERSQFAVLDRATLKPLRRVEQGRNQHIFRYQWVSERRVVLSMGVRMAGTEMIGWTGELWSLDVETGNSRYLYGMRGHTAGDHVAADYGIAWLIGRQLDAEGRILVAIQGRRITGEKLKPQFARLHVENGSVRALGKAPVTWFRDALTDATGQLRLVTGTEDDRKLKTWQRADDSAEWQLLNDGSVTGAFITPLAFLPGDTAFYASIDDGKGPAGLWKVELGSGKRTRLLTPQRASIGEALFGADVRRAFAVRTQDGQGGVALLAPKSPEAVLTRHLLQQFPGELVAPTSFSRDGRFATVLLESDRQPGETFLHDRESGALQQLIRSRPLLDPASLSPMQVIQFKARDGLPLDALLTVPREQAAQTPGALVVLPHGGPYGVVDRWGFDAEAQLLASRGYAVLQVNFRGSGGYGERFQQAGIGEWGARMQDDLADATRWAIDQRIAEPRRICIYGGSYGGYAALMGAVRTPTLYRCAIGYAGVYDLALMRKKGDIRTTALGRDYLDEVLDKDPDWLQARSPAQRAEAIEAAVLLIHGGNDRRVPPAHAERMRAALVAAGNEPDWLFKPREGHGFRKRENRIEMYTRVLAFLDRQIGAQAAPPTP